MKRFDKAITTQRIEETPLHQIDLTGERNVTPIELRFPASFHSTSRLLQPILW